jgi:surface protein
MNEDIKVIIDADEDLTIEFVDKIIKVDVPVYPELENLTVVPSKEEQTITANKGFGGLGEVRVLGDEDLLASNIKKGVSIFGIDGSVEEMPQEVKEGIDNQDEIITTQEITIDNINQIIEQKVLKKEKYKPQYLIFRSFTTGTSLDYETANLDTSLFTNMSNMFYDCGKITNLNLNHFNTSNVTNMYCMFSKCKALTTLDISGFDTSNVTNMSYMFNECENLVFPDLSHFDTSDVTNMSYMFQYCFYNATSKGELDLSNFNTSNVTNMSCMFNYCRYITRLNLSSFDTSKVTNISNMFQTCSNLTYLDIRNFTFDKVTSYSGMFNNVSSSCLIIVKGDTEKQWITSKFTSLKNVKTVAELEV